jgi:hypothetical protein
MSSRDLPIFRDPEAMRILRSAAKRRGVPLDLLRKLVDIQRGYLGSGRQAGITSDFESAIGDYLDERSAE